MERYFFYLVGKAWLKIKLYNVGNDRFRFSFDIETLVDTSPNRLHSNEPYSSRFSTATIIPSRYYCHGAIARSVAESTTAVDEWKRIAIDRRMFQTERQLTVRIPLRVEVFIFALKKYKVAREERTETTRNRIR